MAGEGILGLALNTRIAGVALISNGTLIDYALTLNKEKWTDAKRMKVIAYLLSCTQRFTITHIALSIPTLYEKYPNLVTCVETVKNFFTEKGLPVSVFRSAELRSLLPKEEIQTQETVLRETALRFPELIPLYSKEMTNKAPYYKKLLYAVATALVCEQQLSCN